MDLLAFGDTGWGDELGRAMLMTLAVALTAMALGLVIGALGATAKLAGAWPVRLAARLYTTIFRGIPELLIIYLFFFGSSGGAKWVLELFFDSVGYVEVDAFIIGALAVGLISGSYSTEIFRGAAIAVPRGQVEAGMAAGMSRGLILRRILAPQALRFALPGLGNVWQLTLKDTSLIMVTGLVELMRQSYVAAGSSREPFLFYIAAAAIYLGLTSVSGAGFRRAERWAGRGTQQGAGQ